MAIKTKVSRDTYRSNVKARPMRQNGLEAQYQGIDVTEVNIDHSGLPMLARGGFGSLRNFTKVHKEYIVDVDAEEHFPRAAIIFDFSYTGSQKNFTPTSNINQLNGNTLTITSSNSLNRVFEFTTNQAHTNGEKIGSGNNYAINIYENKYSVNDLITNTTGSITSAFGEEIFSFVTFLSGSRETLDEELVPVTRDKIYLNMLSGTKGSGALSRTGTILDVTTDTFENQAENHKWRLNGFKHHVINERMFYEDLRVDMLQSVTPHRRRKSGYLHRQPQVSTGAITSLGTTIVNMDTAITTSIDPTGETRYTKKLSDETLIRQTPKRQEIFGTYRGNHQWREDIHYLHADQQTWTHMEMQATQYHADLESHITAMMNSNFADEQYIEPNPLSGRVDVFHRLSRVFDLHNEVIYERHPYSVFDQYLDPIQNFRNLDENRYPKRDDSNGEEAFQDVRGTRGSLPANDIAAKGDIRIFFSGVPSAGDNFKLHVGDGLNTRKFVHIKFNSGGNQDADFQGVGVNFDYVDLEINVANAATNTRNEIVAHLATKLNSLIATPVNGVQLDKYYLFIDPDGTFIDIIPWSVGSGYDIFLVSELDDAGAFSLTQTEGIDSLYAGENQVMFYDYFDQEPPDVHDYTEAERYTRIDDEMLAILTFDTGRSFHIDRREWQQSDYIHTATGFINSQDTPQDGIIYREMKR